MKHGLPSAVESINDNSESISSVQSCISRRSQCMNKSRYSIQSLKQTLSYQPPKRLSPNFNTIQQAGVKTPSKLCNIAFATTDRNAQKHKLIIDDEIQYKKIKIDTLIEQTQHNIDHDNEI